MKQVAEVQGVEKALQGVQQGACAVSVSGILIAERSQNSKSSHFGISATLPFFFFCNGFSSGAFDKRLHLHFRYIPQTPEFHLRAGGKASPGAIAKASLEGEVTLRQGAAI